MNDSSFEMATSNLRFGPGATAEVGMDLADLGARRVLLLTDPRMARLPPVATTIDSLERNGVKFQLFDRVRVEPTDASLAEAIAIATAGDFDAYVAVGGGSTIDTAKAANLYATYPADLLAYVNCAGRARPGPCRDRSSR